MVGQHEADRIVFVATHIWIPHETPARFRAMLPAGIDVYLLPSPGSTTTDRLGPGQFVVVSFYRKNFARDVLDRLDDVRVVQTMSAGVDDLIGKIPKGAVLCNAAGVHDPAVADWVVMAILATYRKLPYFVSNQQQGHWSHPAEEGDMSDLERLTVLIVGYGSIGHALESRLAPFGVTILRMGRQVRDGVSDASALPNLLREADVVVILLPLTPETHHFVDARFLSLMRRGALLVNPARGRVVDTDALINALQERRIRAALDVTDPEPLPDGHPLWNLDGVLITPHIAGSVARAYERAWRLVVDQVRRYVNGEPLKNVVADGY